MTLDRIRRLELCLESHLAACQLMQAQFEAGQHILGISLVVSAAFAAELSIKCWHEKKKGSPLKGHEIRDLWDNVDSDIQNKIKSTICMDMTIDSQRFEQYLTQCSKTFVDWRYMYERDNNFTNYLFLLGIARGFKNIIST